VIESYQFGTAELVDDGGWHYASAALYGRTALVEAVAALAAAAVFVVGMTRRSTGVVIAGYALLAVWAAANYLLFSGA
jgi:hypothetical protein